MSGFEEDGDPGAKDVIEYVNELESRVASLEKQLAEARDQVKFWTELEAEADSAVAESEPLPLGTVDRILARAESLIEQDLIIKRYHDATLARDNAEREAERIGDAFGREETRGGRQTQFDKACKAVDAADQKKREAYQVLKELLVSKWRRPP